MDNDGSFWKDYREMMTEQSRKKKADNRKHAEPMLLNAGITIKKHTEFHWLISNNDVFFDYWPSTGKFIARSGGKKGRGVSNLIKQLKGKK